MPSTVHGSVTDSIEQLKNQMESIGVSQSQDIIMMGDANIDMSKRTRQVTLLSAFLSMNNLKQTITRPTRITDTTNSILDHIYINNVNQFSHCGVLEPCRSDHSLTFVCRKRSKLFKE